MDGQKLLKGIYLFEDATDADLTSLLEIATPRKYRQGELVFNEGDEADAMFCRGDGNRRYGAERKRTGGRHHWQQPGLGRSGLFQARQTTGIGARQRGEYYLAHSVRPTRTIARRTAGFRTELLPKRVRIFGQAPSDADNRGGPTLFLRPLRLRPVRSDHEAPKDFRL